MADRSVSCNRNQPQHNSHHSLESDVLIRIESSERTPLLERSSQSPAAQQIPVTKCLDCRLFGIVFLFVGGFTTATYLLLQERSLTQVNFALDLVNREVWNKLGNLSLGELFNTSSALHVLMLHTGGCKCENSEECLALLWSMQKSSVLNAEEEIPYNFLIGGDGQTYEIRGWEHQSGLPFIPRQSSLVIGFIGNYTFEPPTDEQLQSALSLINESLRRRKIHDNYQVYGIRNLTISRIDGAEMHKKISEWSAYDTLLKVL